MTDLDQLAAESWIFGYPLVLMDMTRRVMAENGQPPNTFNHMRAFPDHTFTDVVSPNADTLYSVGLAGPAGRAGGAVPAGHGRAVPHDAAALGLDRRVRVAGQPDHR